MASSKCRWQCPEQWGEWSEWLAAGLHARSRWRLPLLLVGMLFAQGRRTVTTWLRAAGVSDDFQDYYYFLAAVGRKTNSVATRLTLLVLRMLPLPDRLLLVIDDSPTKRYGPKVEGADVHRNPTPGPADQAYLYGHIWVTISLALRHPKWGAMALPLRAMLYVRKKTMATIPRWRHWRFATKLQLAARLAEWIVPLLKKAGKTVWIVVDGGYTKRPFLKRVLKFSNVVVVGRLRKDAAVRNLPPKRKPGHRRGRGRPRKYGIPPIPTTIFIHGNRTNRTAAIGKGWRVYRQMRRDAAGQPFRLVIWSWPSDRIRGRQADDLHRSRHGGRPPAVARPVAEQPHGPADEAVFRSDRRVDLPGRRPARGGYDRPQEVAACGLQGVQELRGPRKSVRDIGESFLTTHPPVRTELRVMTATSTLKGML